MNQNEFRPLPPEIQRAPAEIAPPAPEFADKVPAFPEEKRKKPILFLAAAVLFLGLLAFPQAITGHPAQPETTEQPPASLQTETTPAETAPVTQEETFPPACRPIFFAFSDDLRAKLIFTGGEQILSVHAELWDSLGQTVEQAWDVPREEILRGEYTLPEMMGMYEIYMTHHDTYDPADPFPVPQLHISMTYLDGETETTTQMIQPYTEELGWSLRIRDGEIILGTYESYSPVSIRVVTDASAQKEAPESGELLVMLQINGTTVDGAHCTVSQEEAVWQTADGEDITFYYASLHTPRQGETGKVSVTVCQKLTGYDILWTETAEATY